MRNARLLTLFSAGALFAISAGAQTPAYDPSARLREVLPADIAQKVLATIADARAHELPARALEQRALKFAAKGVEPELIANSIAEQAERMEKAKAALGDSRGRRPAANEIEAGAEALRQGVTGADVSELAKSAPSGRSLAVPLFVIGSLVDRGLPSDEALQRVLDRMEARATDRELEGLPSTIPGKAIGQANRPEGVGRPLNHDVHEPDAGSSRMPVRRHRPPRNPHRDSGDGIRDGRSGGPRRGVIAQTTGATTRGPRRP